MPKMFSTQCMYTYSTMQRFWRRMKSKLLETKDSYDVIDVWEADRCSFWTLGCVHTTQFPCNFVATIACILGCKRIAPSCTHLLERFTVFNFDASIARNSHMIGRKWIKDKVIYTILKTFRMHRVDSSCNSETVSYTHLTLPTILLV